MFSNNLRNNELEFTPTFETQLPDCTQELIELEGIVYLIDDDHSVRMLIQYLHTEFEEIIGRSGGYEVVEVKLAVECG